MFTGIIQAVGELSEVREHQDSYSLTIKTPKEFLNIVSPGDSICVQGVCLTVTQFTEDSFDVDVSSETMRCTTFSQLAVQQQLNLELALTLSARLGGHLVSGHVDGVGEIQNITQESESIVLTIKSPQDIARYIARKGSICIDGISLTVNQVDKELFSVNIIPHTLENTTILTYQVGTKVNLEIDLVARYIERMQSYKN